MLRTVVVWATVKTAEINRRIAFALKCGKPLPSNPVSGGLVASTVGSQTLHGFQYIYIYCQLDMALLVCWICIQCKYCVQEKRYF